MYSKQGLTHFMAVPVVFTIDHVATLYEVCVAVCVVVCVAVCVMRCSCPSVCGFVCLSVCK